MARNGRSRAGCDAVADKIKEEWGESDDAMTKATDYLTAEVEEYSQWASGEVYGYVCYTRAITTTVTTHADGTVTETVGETWDQVDSCWGFIGEIKESGMRTNGETAFFPIIA